MHFLLQRQSPCIEASRAQNSRERGKPSPGFPVRPGLSQAVTAGLDCLKRLVIEFLNLGFVLGWEDGWGGREHVIIHKTPANTGKTGVRVFGGESLRFH